MSSMARSWRGLLRLTHLTGPILDKELRVESRRRRNYAVRAAYLALLTLFVTLVWLSTVPHHASGVSLTWRLAVAGQAMTMLIVWFQFLACQAVAIVMLSTAISDEVSHRTLGVLMTTPINSLQIVIGKLVGRLVQVLLLMAVSLPLLAIVRVFGGIPWAFLGGSWVLTLTTTLFVGSVSLLFSISCRRAYAVIAWATLSLAVLWGLIPLLAVLVATQYRFISEPQLESFFSLTHPYVGLGEMSAWFASPRALPLGVRGAWLWPSLVMAIGTIGVLTIAVSRVRAVARRQISGEGSATGPSRVRPAARTSRRPVPVKGCPVLWKEMRAPLLGRRRGLTVVALGLALGSLAVMYAVAAGDGRALDDQGFHMAMVFVFMLVGVFFCVVIPATTITSEKEGRSWPILLATPLGDWRIVLAKGLGAIRRGLPAWAFLAVHVLAFTIAGLIHPLAILQLAMVVTGQVAFLTGTGLYFSSRFRHTTAAVIANIAVPAVLWVLMPIVLAMVMTVFRLGHRGLERYMLLCPFRQALASTEACTGASPLRYSSWGGAASTPGGATVLVLMAMGIYVLLGFLCARQAKCRLRKRVF